MKWCIVAEENIYSEMFEIMFLDAVKEKEAVFLKQYLEEKGLRKRLLDLLYKNKVNYYLKDCFEPFFKPVYALENFLKACHGSEAAVVFLNGSLQKFYTEKKLRRLKKDYPKTSFILLFVDPLSQKHTKKALELAERGLFDLVYSFDPKDAEKQGFIYCQTPYSRIENRKSEQKIQNRVYFCGSEKGRADILERVAEQLESLNIDYRFDVYGKNKRHTAFKISYGLTSYKKYHEILEDTLENTYILDIVQQECKDQAGLSLRIYEATVYDKILLTNNPNILKYPYYNEQTMHYFSEPKEIQRSWFERKAHNTYQNELSPVYFLEEIQRHLQNI